MPAFAFSAALLALLSLTRAAPSTCLQGCQSITTLSASQISAFTPYTWYASTGYCAASKTLSWSCGRNCEANANFEPVASGGDGDGTQYCEFAALGFDGTRVLTTGDRVCGI